MKHMHLAALLVLLAVGCSQSSAPEAGSDETPDLQVSIPSIEQSAVTDSGAELTTVTLSVPGMT